MPYRTLFLRALLFLPLCAIVACSSNPSAPGTSTGASKPDTTRRVLTIASDATTPTVHTRVTFTLLATPALPKPYSVSWRIDSGSSQTTLLRSNTDTLSYTFATLGRHTVRAAYIDATGTQRDSATTTITIADTVPPLSGGLGAFVIMVNNQVFDRSTVPTFCDADAFYFPTQMDGSPGNRIQIAFDYSQTEHKINGDVHLAFWIKLTSFLPSTYTLGNSDDLNGDYAQLNITGQEYNSTSGGTLTITSFDTVHNSLSGTFAMVLQDAGGANVFDTVKGSFRNVCFNIGLFGQGLFTANAGPNTIQTNGAKNYLKSEYEPGTDQLRFQALQGDSSQQVLTIWITSPAVGTFPVAWPPRSGNSYFEYSAGFDNYSTQSGGPGSLTITAFDPVTRRVSGTFSFTGHTQTGGKKIDVTGGIIDNVMWGHD